MRDKRVESGTRKIIRHLDSLEGVILRISLFVFLISALSEIFMLKIQDIRMTIGDELKNVITLAFTGLAGVLLLSVVLHVFVHFLRDRTSRMKELEIKVVSAFMKALDESTLKYIADKK